MVTRLYRGQRWGVPGRKPVRGRADADDSAKLSTTRDYLIDYFGADRPLQDITPGDADDWRISLIEHGNGENTLRKHAQIAKQFFTAAVKRRLIATNQDISIFNLNNKQIF